MPTQKLTPEIITAAIEGFEHQKTRINQQIAELRELLFGAGAESRAKPRAKPEAPTGKRKRFSAAARQRMKEAQQRRWARIKGESPSPAKLEPAKPKRKLSAAGRKAIQEAVRRRWAAKRAEAANAAPKKASQKKAAKKVVPVNKAAKKTATASSPAATKTAAE